MKVFAPAAFRWPVGPSGTDYPYGWQDLPQSLADTLISAGLLAADKPDNAALSPGEAYLKIKSTSGGGLPPEFPGIDFNPAEQSVVPGVAAGVLSPATGPFTLNPRGAGFSGWGYLYTRDPNLWFDTITLPGLARNAGLTGNNQWASIIVEVADASDETSDTTIFGSTDVIAKATVAVDPSLDTLPALIFSLQDLAGRPLVLGPHNLPSRYVIRYRAVSSVDTRAVVGDVRAAIAPAYFVQAIGYSVPTKGVTQVGTGYQDQSTGAWVLNGTQLPAFALALSAAATSVVIRQPEGRYNLPNWLSRLARILDGQTVTATILGIGDSWMHNNIRFARPIARALKSKFGDAGPGFLGFALAFAGTYAGGADDAQASVARTGAWIDDLTASAKGLDAYSVSSTTVGDAITITLGGTARRAKLHYYAQAGGGDVRWKVGAGAWTTIAMAGAAGMATAAIDFGAEITGTTITIEVLTAGAGVVLHGIDLQRDIAGVRVHKLGHSGGQATTFTSIAESITLTEVASLLPDLCLICLTTNELTVGTPPATMIANIEVMIRRIRKARPYCDFAIIAPFDNATESTVYPWADYETALWALARKHRAVFFPTRALIGHWGDANKRGLIQDAIPHPTSAGGQLLSGVLLRDFLSLGL
jgi:hypothetical protein